MEKVVLSIYLIASLFLLASAVPVLEAESNEVNDYCDHKFASIWFLHLANCKAAFFCVC